MLKNFWKKLDEAAFPKPTGSDYAKEALQLSKYEYLKSLDAIDFAVTNAEYHRRRIERYKTYEESKNNSGDSDAFVQFRISETFDKPATGDGTV